MFGWSSQDIAAGGLLCPDNWHILKGKTPPLNNWPESEHFTEIALMGSASWQGYLAQYMQRGNGIYWLSVSLSLPCFAWCTVGVTLAVSIHLEKKQHWNSARDRNKKKRQKKEKHNARLSVSLWRWHRLERNPITTVTVTSAVLAASHSFKAELTVESQRVGGDPVQPTTILKLCRFGVLQHVNYIAQCSICPENSLTFAVQLIFAQVWTHDDQINGQFLNELNNHVTWQ